MSEDFIREKEWEELGKKSQIRTPGHKVQKQAFDSWEETRWVPKNK